MQAPRSENSPDFQEPAEAPWHWSCVSPDPMNPGLINRRQAQVAAAHRSPIPDRVSHLRALARGRRVLDLGVVDHTVDTERSERWLHGQLVEVAGTALGIDVVADEVERLSQRGYHVTCMDVTTGELPDGEWDLIVAGELVEHLGRPGRLFDAAAALLARDGKFVLTSPNPYAAWRIVQNLRGRPFENVDHALLLSPWGIAELADRAGLRLHSYRGIAARPIGRKARLLDWAVRRRLLPVVPESTCESLLYEVVRT